MQRWRVLFYVAFASAFLAAPSWVLAQQAKPANPVAAPVSVAAVPAAESALELFAPLTEYDLGERVGLILTLLIAIAGLGYAGMLVGQVLGADQGTQKMRDVADAVREGAWAYLMRQAVALLPLVFVITAILYFTAIHHRRRPGRSSGGFLPGSPVLVAGRLRGHESGGARQSSRRGRGPDELWQRPGTGYRTGTITGMLTDGLGLLGGTTIFIVFGEKAYEVLLGFGFGGTLLVLFMRVGGGIFTKAADVGADLVGKVEANISEDDPRNAATIADNVGDNVGDCAGMAADIFESYEVTIVAAMILGYASFGHKGVIFPLLVRAIGVVGSIISTYSVRAGADSTSDEALHLVHRGFLIGSVISVVGFMLLGLAYLHFDDAYMRKYPQAAYGFKVTADFEAARNAAVSKGTPLKDFTEGYTGPILDNAAQPVWANFGTSSGLDMRPAWTCLIGIILAVALYKCTSYYTHTQYEPVKSMAKACQTGHATNIIQGPAVGDQVGRGGHDDHRHRDPPVGAHLLRLQSTLHRLWRGHVRHRHADPDRQHDLDGRVRPGGRQRQRHRRDGL